MSTITGTRNLLKNGAKELAEGYQGGNHRHEGQELHVTRAYQEQRSNGERNHDKSQVIRVIGEGHVAEVEILAEAVRVRDYERQHLQRVKAP
jgi:hypothetical protein